MKIRVITIKPTITPTIKQKGKIFIQENSIDYLNHKNRRSHNKEAILKIKLIDAMSISHRKSGFHRGIGYIAGTLLFSLH